MYFFILVTGTREEDYNGSQNTGHGKIQMSTAVFMGVDGREPKGDFLRRGDGVNSPWIVGCECECECDDATPFLGYSDARRVEFGNTTFDQCTYPIPF